MGNFHEVSLDKQKRLDLETSSEFDLMHINTSFGKEELAQLGFHVFLEFSLDKSMCQGLPQNKRVAM